MRYARNLFGSATKNGTHIASTFRLDFIIPGEKRRFGFWTTCVFASLFAARYLLCYTR